MFADRNHSRMFGSTIFYLEMTDYTNSSLNHNRINITQPMQTFKQSSYFNIIKNRVCFENSDETLEINIKDKEKPVKISSRKGTMRQTTTNKLDMLTQAQKKTIKSHYLVNSANSHITNSKRTSNNTEGKLKKIRFLIPNISSGASYNKITKPIIFNGRNISPIIYNGKNDIIKIGIALYDQNDFPIDLHGDGIIVTFNSNKNISTVTNKE